MIVLIQTRAEALIHGVSYFQLRGRRLTAIHRDGTRETAQVSRETADAIRAFHAYSTGNGEPCACPCGFRLIDEIRTAQQKANQQKHEDSNH